MKRSPGLLKWMLAGLLSVLSVIVVSIYSARGQNSQRPTITTDADFRRAMMELSNAGRWGANDELGAANFITPAKRKQAVMLAKEGISISLAHDIVQETAPDAPTILERTMVTVSPTVAMDRLQYSGT